MDALMLSRIQFAFTVAYHFLFVPISIGLAVTMALAEYRHYRTRNPIDGAAARFWIKLFTTTFAIGVATGITMEFAFGTNWANYSRFVGSIFGAPLAAEGLFAFFLESTFLGILLFGRKRVSPKFYMVSAWLVMVGALLSALWILIANSWQQTPAGYEVIAGRAILTDFWAAAFNPSTAPRYVHTVVGAIITGTFVVASISAWYLLKNRHQQMARASLSRALVLGLILSALMPIIGHWHALVVAQHQPIKMAAFENIGETQKNAPLYLAGWVVEDGKTLGLAIPSGLSLMLGLSPSHEVQGVLSVPAGDRPPIQLTFQSYHIMITLSFLFILIMLVALVLHLRGKLEKTRWLLWVLVVSFPLPIIAMNAGWVAAEVGRQPWIVQGMLRTTDGVSPVVSAGEVATTLAIFAVLYALLFIGWLRIFLHIIRTGPDVEPVGETVVEPEPALIEGEAGRCAQ